MVKASTMSTAIQELYPEAGKWRPLEGTYLDSGWVCRGTSQAPFVYANFVSSLDGRIALAEPSNGDPGLPEELPNSHDFRLFQELQAHAECQVVHGNYLRALERGELGNILQIGISQDSKDLEEWRRRQGLLAQPGVAVISRTLDFSMPNSVGQYGQPVHILTGRQAAPDRVRYWREQGYEVRFAGKDEAVEGGALIQSLSALGYSRIHLLAGPELLTTVLRAQVLSRLFVTITHQILGGEVIHTLTTGPRLREASCFRLCCLYYDPSQPRGAGQWFAAFDLRR